MDINNTALTVTDLGPAERAAVLRAIAYWTRRETASYGNPNFVNHRRIFRIAITRPFGCFISLSMVVGNDDPHAFGSVCPTRYMVFISKRGAYSGDRPNLRSPNKRVQVTGHEALIHARS